MIGFIKKDLLMLRSNVKLWIVLLFIYIAISFQEETNFMFLLPFMSVVTMLSTFSYDNYNKWDAYVITLPNGRKNSIKAKYIATIMIIVATIVIMTIVSCVIAYVRTKAIGFEDMFSNLLVAVFATALMQSFMYPAIYKVGVDKARMVIFLLVFGIAIIGGVIAKLVDFAPLIQKLEFLNNYWMFILPVIVIVMLYVSYKISEGIYKKKEY